MLSSRQRCLECTCFFINCPMACTVLYNPSSRGNLTKSGCAVMLSVLMARTLSSQYSTEFRCATHAKFQAAGSVRSDE